MDRDDIELFVAILGTVGTFILVYLDLDSSDTSNLTSWIPSIFSGWVETVLIIVFVLYILWYILKFIGGSGLFEDVEVDVSLREVDVNLRELDAIEGCIQKGGVAWKGTAYLNRGVVENIEVPYKPICPKCQTGLVDRTQEPSMQEQRRNPSYSPEAQPTEVFSCSNDNCEHTVARDTDQYDEVKHLFERHAKRITETRDEDYSLRTLIENIDNGVTPQSVWEEYAEIVDDEQVSTNCFH
ncbi:MAG: Yip1 family protein [Halobacteriales archaeon]